MEAGYDYLHIHGRLQRHIASFTGIFLLVFGFLLLASGGAYYAYSANAKSNLDDLSTVMVPMVPMVPRLVASITGSSASNITLQKPVHLTALFHIMPDLFNHSFLSPRKLKRQMIFIKLMKIIWWGIPCPL